MSLDITSVPTEEVFEKSKKRLKRNLEKQKELKTELANLKSNEAELESILSRYRKARNAKQREIEDRKQHNQMKKRKYSQMNAQMKKLKTPQYIIKNDHAC